jgi:hypothetical protein
MHDFVLCHKFVVEFVLMIAVIDVTLYARRQLLEPLIDIDVDLHFTKIA